MAEVIDARVRQKKDTLDNWMANTLVLLDGEQAFVVDGNGQPINFKIGDGTKTFAELPFWIQYDQGQYVAVTGSSLPDPPAEVGYTLASPGTYTQSEGADITVPTGTMGLLGYASGTWTINDLIQIGVAPVVGTADTEFDFETASPGFYMATESGTYQPGNVVVDLTDQIVILVWDGSSTLTAVPLPVTGTNAMTLWGSGAYRSASVGPDPNTVVLRDGDGWIKPVISTDFRGWKVFDYGWKKVYRSGRIEDSNITIGANSFQQGQLKEFPVGIEYPYNWDHLAFNAVTGENGVIPTLRLDRTDPEAPDHNAFRFAYRNVTGGSINIYSSAYIEITVYIAEI